MSTLHRSVTLALLSGTLAIVGACRDRPLVSRLEGDRQRVNTSQVQTPLPAAVPLAASPTVATAPDAYALGLARASSAFNISQSAQSKDDWHLVSERWQQAIQFMSAVPKSSQHHAEAALKLTDYRRNLAFAQQQRDRPTSHHPNLVVRRSVSNRSNLAPNRRSPLLERLGQSRPSRRPQPFLALVPTSAPPPAVPPSLPPSSDVPEILQ
ncbi:MAG: hypothetical protein HC781_20935 [Leptolyngbyaceae cyanobacterium CSU_1_4]|nr:hypothetical protein [Leptolyngbyaceae cyanobacterium CSU_1_4]